MKAALSIPEQLRRRPFFAVLLPLLTLWHGCNTLVGFIPLHLALHYLLLTGCWTLLCWLLSFAFSRRVLPAAGIAFFLTLAFLFYGPVSDAMHAVHPRLASHKLLPVLLAVAAISAGVLLFQKPARARSTTYFLNVLLLLLLLVEGGSSLIQLSARKKRELFTGPGISESYRATIADSARPDIYLLVMDEYAGPQTLRRMGFDNQPFLDSLQSLGCRVAPGSRTNYDFTPFSVASLLQMQYIDSSHERSGDDAATVVRAVRAISDNETVRILRREGYTLHYEVPFDNRINPKPTLNEFGDFPWKVLFGPTLPGRVFRDRAWHPDPFTALFPPVYSYNDAVQRRKDLEGYRRGLYAVVDSNAARPPRFVYQHLLLTHHPYLFDAQSQPRQQMASAAEEPSAYIDQVRYANRVMLEQVARIRREGRRNTVILLLSDHGYRQGAGDPFENLFALYAPTDTSGMPDPATPVNAFRDLFNRSFGQHWPLLPARSVPVRYK